MKAKIFKTTRQTNPLTPRCLLCSSNTKLGVAGIEAFSSPSPPIPSDFPLVQGTTCSQLSRTPHNHRQCACTSRSHATPWTSRHHNWSQATCKFALGSEWKGYNNLANPDEGRVQVASLQVSGMRNACAVCRTTITIQPRVMIFSSLDASKNIGNYYNGLYRDYISVILGVILG